MSSANSFDDFDRVEERTAWTNVFSCVYGSYKWLNPCPVHYFSTTLSVEDLRKGSTVSLMDEIDGVERWGFDAIFQRNINHRRVTDIVRTYLRRDDRFKFFPAITVVLLPARNNRILAEFPDPFEQTESENTHFWRTKGLEVRFRREAAGLPRSNQPTKLKWDRARFMAAVVDGQHRVAAIREFIGKADQTSLHKEIPAIIVLFDPELPKHRNLVQLTRELFIDVNQNATPVADSRLIVLDDRDVARAATRSLIYESKEDETGCWTVPKWSTLASPVDDLKISILPGIPQETVDAFAERERVDLTKLREWQFTSAFTVARIIQNFVFENKWRQFERILDLRTLEEEGGALAQAIAERRELLASEDEDDEVSVEGEEFAFSPALTKRLVASFQEGIGTLLRAVFTGFTPYERLLKVAVDSFHVADGELLRSFLINEAPGAGRNDEKAKNFSSSTLKLRDEDPSAFDRITSQAQKISKPEKWVDELVWFSVLQRAFFWQPLEIKTALATASDVPHDSWAACAATYVGMLNRFYAKGIFRRDTRIIDKSLWNGILLKGEAIDYTDGAARRGACLLRLLVAGSLLHDRGQKYEALEELLGSSKRDARTFRSAWDRCLKSYSKAYLTADKQANQKLKDQGVYDQIAGQHLKTVLETLSFRS